MNRPLLVLVAWWTLIAFGFGYVSVVLCDRDNPFRSGNAGLQDFLVVGILAPIFFLLGPRHNLTRDASSEATPRGRDLALYLMAFFSALHWEYVGHAINVHVSLKPADLGSMDLRSGLALALAALIILTLLGLHFVWAHREGILGVYLVAFCGIPILAVIVSLGLRDTHYIHVHHYCLGAFLFPFFRFRNAVSLVAQASFLGLAIEGISRWGMDPVWYPLASH